MARTSNLTDFLTDVSSAIKQKTGDSAPIPASEFDTEILSIETGGNYQSKTLNITQNGNYNLLPDQEFDAISNVNISVSVSPVLQNKTITENGSYTADQNYDGLGTVIVNVPQTGDVPVKLFETEEQMQADTTAKEGDKAVVYRSEIQNMTADMEVTSLTFPDTVTLPTAFTGNARCRLRAVDSSVMFDGNCDLSKTSFRFDSWSESGMIRAEYTSTDGITYTRTRFQGDSGDLTNPVEVPTCKVYRTEEWNDNLGYFMQIGGMCFEGLFQYLKVDTNNQLTLNPLSLNISDTTINLVQAGPILNYEILKSAAKYLSQFYTDDEFQFDAYIDYDNKVHIIYAKSGYNSFTRIFVVNKSNPVIYMGPSGSTFTEHFDAIYDDTEKTFKNEQSIAFKTMFKNVSSSGFNCIKINGYPICPIGIQQNNYDKWRHFNSTIYYLDTIDSNTNINITDSNLKLNEMITKYTLAPTQLTLTKANELFPGVIAYGKNGIIEGDGSIYNNLNYRNIIGSYIPAYTFVSTLGDDNGKKLVHSNNINDNGIWKTTVISKENSGFGYNFYGGFEDSAGTALTATKNYIITVEKIIGDNNDSRRIWNVYDKYGSLLYNFTQNTNVDRRWATIFAIELTDGRLLYASHNWNEAWSGSGGSQTIISGYIDTKNGSHTEVNYTWSGEQFIPEGIWYDGTDYYIGVASWSNNLIVLKNGKLWVNAKSTDSSNYYGGYICGDDTYIYMTAGTDTTPIIVVNKQTKAVSVINSSVFDNKQAYIGYDTDTNKCYVTANKKLYSLSGTSTRVIATLTRNIAISSIFRYKNINGKVLCISNYGAYQCNVTDDISTTYSLERFSGYDDCYNDTYIIETQDSDNVYISQLLCGVTTDSGSINDKFLAFNTEKSPINNKANTYMILSNEIDDYTPYTISQEEYNTAIDTADIILGEEV